MLQTSCPPLLLKVPFISESLVALCVNPGYTTTALNIVTHEIWRGYNDHLLLSGRNHDNSLFIVGHMVDIGSDQPFIIVLG